jgi:hypothetical protein
VCAVAAVAAAACSGEAENVSRRYAGVAGNRHGSANDTVHKVLEGRPQTKATFDIQLAGFWQFVDFGTKRASGSQM